MATENLGLEIRMLSNLIYNRMNQQTMEAENISAHQCLILQYLVGHGESDVYQKDIEQLFSIRRSTANQMLRSLESRGLLERNPSPDDSRKNVITATSAGKQACEVLNARMYQFMKKLYGDIDQQELESFQITLRKLWHNIE